MSGKENVLYISESGKMKIKDPSLFIKLMMNDETIDGVSPQEAYDFMYRYGIKQMKKYHPDIPPHDYPHILNYAIAKTVKDFQEGKASILPYFFEKIRGEVHAYRETRKSLHKKALMAFHNQENGAREYLKEYGKNDEYHLTLSSSETIEEQTLREDFYARQVKAFKMAFSGLPRISQIILYEIGKGTATKTLSEALGMEENDIKLKRNFALSLLLQRVLRSRHLDEKEKREILKIHNIEPQGE